MNPFKPMHSGVGPGANCIATKVCQWKRGGGGGRSEATAGPTEKCICNTRGTPSGNGSSRSVENCEYTENVEGTLTLRSNENLQSQPRA